jgi:hypothetical protein
MSPKAIESIHTVMTRVSLDAVNPARQHPSEAGMSSPHPWQVLAGLPAWQLTEILRPGEDPHAAGTRDLSLPQRIQALASAYGRGAPLALAWVRDQPGGPVRVLAAGPALRGGHDQGQVVLTLPAGARAVAMQAGEAARALAAVPCWARIGGVTDALLGDDGTTAGLERAPSLDESLLPVWLDGFAWLLLAVPASQDAISAMAADAGRAQLAVQQFSSPRAKLAARRHAARHDELARAASAGLWHLHLLAGAATPADAACVAQMLCSSADLRGLPYALSVQPGTGPLPEVLAAPAPVSARSRARARDRAALAAREQDRSWWDTPIGAQPPALVADGQHAAGYATAVAYAEQEYDDPEPGSPFFASTRLVAALARTPAEEVPGIRFTLRPAFDITPETTPVTGDQRALGMTAGTVLDRNRVPAGPLVISRESLNRHVFVCGATGSGKSQTIRSLLEAATAGGIPWLVIEPAKAEYQLMAARLPGTEVIVIRPGDLDLPPAGINPLEPATGPDGTRFPLQTHADLLRALFLAAFQADEPFPQVLAAALTRCYEQAGWDLVTGQPATPGVQPDYPALADLQAAAIQVVDQTGYGREVADNVRGFVTVRLASLQHGTAGRFLAGGHPLDFGRLLEANVVFQIEDVGDDRDKAFLMGAMLIQLTEHLRLRHRRERATLPGLRHLTVVEEAHRLLRQPPAGTGNGPAAQATEMFADLLAEVRAYGEGLIIAEQIPSKLIPDVIKNTAVKITHRLPAQDDRDTVGATMNLTAAQSQYLVTLPPGEAAVFTDGMDYPILARMPDGTVREAAETVPAAGPGPVIGRRSGTCGPECGATACTLAEIRAAQRATITDPRITLWAELSVLAHLTGWPLPVPGASFTSDLAAMPARVRDCAFSHAVDTAVAARIPAISTRVSPGALAVHVTDVMRDALAGDPPGCAISEICYLAPPYRWATARDTLRSACRAGTPAGRHPRSGEWEHHLGQLIPGETCGQQLTIVHQRYAADQRAYAEAIPLAIWGTRPATEIERAVGTRATSPDWPQQLTSALETFKNLRWPRNYLLKPRAPSP